MTLVPQPGPLLVAIDLHLMADRPDRLAVERHFSRPSLAVAENSDGTAVYATDFLTDPDGFVRILVLDRGLGAERAGALVQRAARTRDLSHARFARPAQGAGACALDQPDRTAAVRK